MSLLIVALGAMVAVMVLAAATAPPAESAPTRIKSAFVGKWTGYYDEPQGAVQRYRAALTLHQPRGPNVVGISRYVGLECGGYLYLRRAEGNTLYLREEISFGPCIDSRLKATLLGSTQRRLDIDGDGYFGVLSKSQ